MKNTLKSVLIIVLGILVVVEGAMLLDLHRPYTADGKDSSNPEQPAEFQLVDGTSSSRMSSSQASPAHPQPTPPQVGQVSGWDPFAEMERMRRHMDAMMQRGGQPGASGDSFVVAAPGQGFEPVPEIAMEETDEAYVCTLDVPCIEEKTLRVAVEQETLQITGVRTMERTHEHGGRIVARIHQREQFTRSLHLPGPVDPIDVQAHYKDGVLSVALPKMAGEEPPRISVPR